MLLKVRKWTVVSPTKNYQNSLKRALLRRKKLHAPFNLAYPIMYWRPVAAARRGFKMVLFTSASEHLCRRYMRSTECPSSLNVNSACHRNIGLKRQSMLAYRQSSDNRRHDNPCDAEFERLAPTFLFVELPVADRPDSCNDARNSCVHKQPLAVHCRPAAGHLAVGWQFDLVVTRWPRST